jgi:hypothetical protein
MGLAAQEPEAEDDQGALHQAFGFSGRGALGP